MRRLGGHDFWVLGRLGARRLAAGRRAGPLPNAPGLATAPGWTDGLNPQGIIGLMISLTLYQVWRDDITRSVLAAVAIAAIINELITPLLMTRSLRGIASRSREATR